MHAHIYPMLSEPGWSTDDAVTAVDTCNAFNKCLESEKVKLYLLKCKSLAGTAVDRQLLTNAMSTKQKKQQTNKKKNNDKWSFFDFKKIPW